MIRSVLLLGALALPVVSQVTACDPPPPAAVHAECHTPDGRPYTYDGPAASLPESCDSWSQVGPALPPVTADGA